jgi:hydrogenase/urease accessory protein HupE
MKKIFATMSGLAAAPVLFAHPGHGETEGFTIIHYFTEPTHAVVTVLAVAAVIGLYQYLRRRETGKKA